MPSSYHTFSNKQFHLQPVNLIRITSLKYQSVMHRVICYGTQITRYLASLVNYVDLNIYVVLMYHVFGWNKEYWKQFLGIEAISTWPQSTDPPNRANHDAYGGCLIKNSHILVDILISKNQALHILYLTHRAYNETT